MKKIILSLAIAMSGSALYAQTNTFPSSGNVGIGTASPATTLDVKGIIRSTTGGVQIGKFGITSNPELSIGIDRPEFNKSTIINGWDNDNNPGISVGTTRNDGTAFSVVTGATMDGNYLPAARQNVAFTVLGNGQTGIGTQSPDAKLTVNGTIHSKEVKVDASIPVPDYVFEKTYKLINLTELQSYLDANHHLPEIPSAFEVEQNGLNLSEMNLKLLKKVEELTLYLIEKDKELKAQQTAIQYLQQQIDQLKSK